ncbi:MAG TPA: metal-sulfur cluster assembly factor [Sulfurovum sp.]|nr:metal-sulfur cluster assembly factor [Sulfurovum sp.]
MCTITKENVFDAISTVIDPEVGFNLVEMGLIYDAIIAEESCDVHVIMTLSTQGCPLHQMIKQWVYEAVEKIENVGAIEVEVVWEPAWNISMADDNVKAALAGM